MPHFHSGAMETILFGDGPFIPRINTKYGAIMVSLDYLSGFFVYRARDAAEMLGIGIRRFMKMCRQLGIRRWPFQRIRTPQDILNARNEAVININYRTSKPRIEIGLKCTQDTCDVCLRRRTAVKQRMSIRNFLNPVEME